MRLIDADKLKQNVLDWEDCYNGCSDTYDKARIIGEIEEQPTIDAELVIRCKDCKFNYANQIPSGDGCQLCVELPISKDFFCAYGERMDEDDE